MPNQQQPPRPARLRRRERQLSLALPLTHGGCRKGAGRNPNGDRAGVPHATRPRFVSRHAAHVTMSVLRSVPNLRRRALVRLFDRAVLASHRPETFRVVHYGLMHDHFHLIVEAQDRMALARGMQGLNIRIAKRVNRAVGRNGRCFADRYHRHDLRTPLEARRALRYVLLNRQIWLARRGRSREMRGIDGCSSGRWFDGWARPIAAARDGPVVLPPRTWLLRVGWRRWGRIEPPS